MKILLCGDYSSVHSELAKGLRSCGCDVTVLSDGDSYKNLKADILAPKTKEFRSWKKIFYYLTDLIGINGILVYLKFKKNLKLERYDVVQVINPVVVPAFGALGNALFLCYLNSLAKKLVLCALGDDKEWVGCCLKGKFKYSPFKRLKFSNIHKYYYSLKYVYSPAYIFLDYIAKCYSSNVVAGLYDYYNAYEGKWKTSLIRLPIAKERFSYPKNNAANSQVVVFHAWQKGKELKKGNDLLHQAMLNVLEIYNENQVKYVIASGLTYDEFLKSYDECDIFLDQVYSYDCGVSAALGLASGKVVFSGFETISRFSTESPESIKTIGVNASDDVELMKQAICYLIDNPLVINKIKQNGFEFAVDHYDLQKVSKEYIELWKA